MTMAVSDSQTTEANELVITRVLNAPRERVWQMWSEAKHLAHWWGPKEGKAEIIQFDFRPGGIFHYGFKMPDGGAVWGKFVYREIEPIERLVYVDSFVDENGDIVRAPFSAEFPLEILNAVTFIEDGDKTTLTLRSRPINASEDELQFFTSMRAGMQQGFGGMLDVLDDYLANN